jgi:serine/threonine protein kinase
MVDLSGQHLGRYYLAERLGEGGMAVVYKAYDTRLERNVAIKIIRSAAFPVEELDQVLKRFEREAKALAKLSYPNIVKVHDYGEHEGSPYLVMEYLPGGTLKKMLGKPVPWQEAVRLILPVARGVAYAHQRGILHRDIKPANILITESGEPMLSDFGIARLFQADQPTALPGSGMVIGTPEYMAPEQWKGITSPQSDLYSLGIVLYEMIAGRKPYIADTPAAILIKQATEPLPPPRQFAINLPEAAESVLFKALARDQQDRYSDVNSLVSALEALQEFMPTVIPATEASTDKAAAAARAESASSIPTRSGRPGGKETAPSVPSPEMRKALAMPAQVQRSRRMVWILAVLAAGALIISAGIAILPRLFAPVPVPATAENTAKSNPSPASDAIGVPSPATAESVARSTPSTTFEATKVPNRPKAENTARSSPSPASDAIGVPGPATAESAAKATIPPATPRASLPPRPMPALTDTPAPRTVPEFGPCSQNGLEKAATVMLELKIGADTTDAPLLLTLGKQGNGWVFAGDSFTCRVNQPGDLKPEQNNVFTFEIPLKFCDMNLYRLTMLQRGEDMAEFHAFSLTIDKIQVWSNSSFGDDPDRLNIRDALGGWGSVDSYKFRCR